METTVMPAVRVSEVEEAEKRRRLLDDRYRLIQLVLFTTGAVLMPGGLIAVGFGWYGAANAHYAYDQFPYLLSGGLLGVCLTTLGGFLYFGAWQARAAADQKAASKQIAEALSTLTELMSWQAAQSRIEAGLSSDPRADLVIAGSDGTTVHRRDCGLIAQRTDLHPVGSNDAGLTPCRVCHPSLT